MIFPKFTDSVGVAPGTTTMRFNGLGMYPTEIDPVGPERAGWYPISPWTKFAGRRQLGEGELAPEVMPANSTSTTPMAPTTARIRWDIIAAVGGGSLLVAMAIGLVASALAK